MRISDWSSDVCSSDLRTELARVDAQILSAKREIRYLETEFSARASMRQLERWNNENFRFSTPTVAQYLDGEKALASLEGMTPNGPAYVATPVIDRKSTRLNSSH